MKSKHFKTILLQVEIIHEKAYMHSECGHCFVTMIQYFLNGVDLTG